MKGLSNQMRGPTETIEVIYRQISKPRVEQAAGFSLASRGTLRFAADQNGDDEIQEKRQDSSHYHSQWSTRTIHSNSQNRFRCFLVDSPLLRGFMSSLQTSSSESLEGLRNWEKKFAEVDGDFFASVTMRNNAWKGVDQLNGHVVAHGFPLETL